MEIFDPLIQRGETPTLNTENKKAPSLLGFGLKIVLFLFMFIFFFHLPYFPFAVPYPNSDEGNQHTIQEWSQEWSGLTDLFKLFKPRLQNREQTIQDILAVLKKHSTDLADNEKEKLAELIYDEALRYHHDPKLILALISIESSFQNWSVSEKGAMGLMQIMPYVAQSIAQELGIEWSGDHTLFNPFLNIRMGTHYLSRLVLDFEDLRIALTAYNYGPNYVKYLIERKQQIPGQYYRKLLAVYQTL